MVIIGIGIAVFALAGLFFWLAGHWFARVVAFLVFGGALGFIGCLLTGPMGGSEHATGGIGLLLGIVLAWPVSGIPVYWHRHQARNTSMEMSLR